MQHSLVFDLTKVRLQVLLDSWYGFLAEAVKVVGVVTVRRVHSYPVGAWLSLRVVVDHYRRGELC